MPLIYRRDLNRPLTFEEMDGNLEYLDRYAEDVEIVVEHLEEIETVAASINGVNAVAGSITSVVTTSLHVDNIDTVAGDVTNIDAVAGNATNINLVAGDKANIDAVAGDLTTINAVHANKANIDIVAGDKANIDAVAGDLTTINAVHANKANIDAVVGNNTNINAVAGNATNINAVNANKANIDAVADDLTTINAVNANKANIDLVAGDKSNIDAVADDLTTINAVHANKSNIDAVADDLTTINAVHANKSNIDAVAGNNTNINAVAGNATNINLVAGDKANIDAVAGDLTNINAVNANKANIDAVAGNNSNITTVAGINTAVSTVASNNTNVSTVATNISSVNTSATNIASINTCATNISDITSASGYASDALDAKNAAEAAQVAAEAVYDNFDDRYLGEKHADPTTDNDGNALITGALYYYSDLTTPANNLMKVYNGTIWVAAYATLSGALIAVNNLSDLSNVSTALENLGLENVTNESKATMFDDSTFTGLTVADSIQFSGGTDTQGTVTWNADEETLDLIQDGATLQLGQELQVHCRNNTISNIGNAVVVMATGTIGMSGRITIAPWDGTTDIKYIVGVTTEVIEAGTDGKVTTFGKVREVDTGAISGTLTTGVIYAKTDGTGGLTYTKPSSNAVPLAFLVSEESSPSANNGTIMVRVTPVSETTLDNAETAYGWGNHALAGYATASNLSAHTSNTSNPHSVTATQVGLGNVENKSSATIRGEITSSNVTTALGYTPYNSTNPSGYITGITSGMVTTALGFTPLSTTGTAADSDKLDGQHGSYYQPASSAITTSNIGSQSVNYATSAGNADTLDGNHASAFQATLVSGSNIKTVGGNSLLGSGDVAISSFPAGTAMLFAQTAAPTGWTKSTTHDNKALRVVSGTAGSGGSTAFTSVFASRTPSGSVSSLSGTVGATTLTIAQMPSHYHQYNNFMSTSPGNIWPYGENGGSGNTGSTGGGGSHSHTFSGSGSLSMNAMDFAVQYVDVIIATKN